MDRGNSFSLRLSQRIDNLIENHLVKNQPRELFIPGLDFGTSGGNDNIFDEYDPDEGNKPKKLKTVRSAS